jgi:hypothetical protein
MYCPRKYAAQCQFPPRYHTQIHSFFFRHVYQLAFFTPGRFPASALIRNWYCNRVSPLCSRMDKGAYSSQPEVAKDTTALAPHYTPVLDLREACVAVHL